MAQSAASGAAYLVLLQLSSRLVTFALNQALLRWTTPAAFGTAAIQLDLLLNTVLFLSREGMRGAVLREKPSMDHTKARLLRQTTWLPFLAGWPIALSLVSLYLWTTPSGIANQPHFYPAVWLYALAALIELASEPFFLDAQLRMDFKLRVNIEGSAVIAKSLVTLGCVVSQSDLGVLAFAFGQLAYGSTILLRFVWKSASSLLPSDGSYDAATLKLAVALSKQSFIKQFLSEGDKMIVGQLATVDDQGGYAVALNYGSLLARCVFQPIEETSRLVFSQAANDRDKTQAQKAIQVLVALLHAHSLLALALVCFGPPYVPTLLRLLLGSRWAGSTAPAILQLYCYLLPFLGFNGVLEAFVQSTVDSKRISSMNRWMGLWSAVYIAACLFFCQSLQLQSKGLVFANMVNMSCRIVWCYRYLIGWARQRRLAVPSSLSIPSKYLIFAWLSAGLLVRATEPASGTLNAVARHMAIGVVAALACIIATYAQSFPLERN